MSHKELKLDQNVPKWPKIEKIKKLIQTPKD